MRVKTILTCDSNHIMLPTILIPQMDLIMVIGDIKITQNIKEINSINKIM
jgi:hypothetical protein